MIGKPLPGMRIRQSAIAQKNQLKNHGHNYIIPSLTVGEEKKLGNLWQQWVPSF
jgi:hypothetical protein